MLQHTQRDSRELEGMARRIRGMLVDMSHRTGAAHLAGSLSCVEIVLALYAAAARVDPADPKDPQRDRIILSKGHCVTTLYAVLAQLGFFPESLLMSFNRQGSLVTEHPNLGCVPGVEATTGSLGHGLSIGAGMALAGSIQERDHRVYVIMSDGECNEGSVWEAAMFAPRHRLDRLVAIVDYNKWQATGRSNEVLQMAPLAAKWKAFGWNAIEVDGHDMAALTAVLSNIPDGSGKPVAVIANTIKGKGVSFMEDDNNWHYRIPTAEEAAAANRELGLA